MMKHHIKAVILCICAVVIAAGLFGAGCSEKKTEIVWYITDPEDYGLDITELKPYQELQSKRFKLFNQRLDELSIPAEVIFKYAPDNYEVSEKEIIDGSYYTNEIQFTKEKISRLTQKTSDADICQFSPLEYKKFLVLDDYFESSGMKKARKEFPKKSWEGHRINGKIYQIPKGNVNVRQTVYYFNKSFLEEYHVKLNKKKLKQMNPKEVVEWLLPYFKKDKILADKYYLTSAADLSYEDYYLDSMAPVLMGYPNNLWLKSEQGQILDSLSTEEMRECLNAYQWIYQNNIDAHENTKNDTQRPVFTTGNIPTVAELTNSQAEADEEEWEEVHLDNAHVSFTIGNGILRDSKNKDLAVEVLAASVYDKELSDLMIHGIPKEDYTLRDGYVVYKEGQSISSMGAYSSVGNNLIAYPNELEVRDKKVKTFNVMKNIRILPFSNFIPDLSGELFNKFLRIANIYYDTIDTAQNSKIPDLKKYLEKQEKKLREAGLEEVIAELQKQADGWVK